MLELNQNDKASLEEVTFKYAQKLQMDLADANVEQTEIDRKDAESLIEQDFLKKPNSTD